MGYHHRGICVLKWEMEGRWFVTALIFSCTYYGQKGYTGTNLALQVYECNHNHSVELFCSHGSFPVNTFPDRNVPSVPQVKSMQGKNKFFLSPLCVTRYPPSNVAKAL